MKTRFTLASASSATALALLLTPVAIAEDGAPAPEGTATETTNPGEDAAAGGDNTTPPSQEEPEGEGAGQNSQEDATPPAPQVRDVELTISCQATPSRIVGPQHVGPEKAAFQLTAPNEVKTGEVFSLDLDLDPVAMDLPLPMGTFESASRLKLDFALPAGVSFVGADIDESAANIKGLSAFTVNEQGYPDPTGRILRFASADNQTIGNSPNSSKSSEGGVTYKAGQNKLDLRFPKVSAKFRATTPGEKAFGVRTAGKAGQYGQDENFLTLLGKVSALGTVWAPVQCAPLSDKAGPVDSAAASLLSVNALPGDGEDALKYSSVDVQITGPNTGTVKERGTYRVALTPDEGEAKDVNGVLTFTDNGRAVMNGEQLLQVPVVRGVAEADLSWLQSGKHTLEARFHPQRDDLSLVLGTGSIDVEVAAAPGENNEQDKNKKPKGSSSSSEGSSAKGFFGSIKEIFEKIFGFFAEFFRSIFKF